MSIWSILLVALLAGAAIPLGGALALASEGRKPLGQPLRRAIIAFGGGALVSAVALVLVPQGSEALPAPVALASFMLGGLAFAALDRRLSAGGGQYAQSLAMLSDFIPEALALGALLATGSPSGLLLAALIALQNLPEGFNAFEEARPQSRSGRRLLARFAFLAFVGPTAAWVGVVFLQGHPGALGAAMVFAAGGILYLTFEDIAPEVREPSGLPALGAVAGFALGLAGHLYIS